MCSVREFRAVATFRQFASSIFERFSSPNATFYGYKCTKFNFTEAVPQSPLGSHSAPRLASSILGGDFPSQNRAGESG